MVKMLKNKSKSSGPKRQIIVFIIVIFVLCSFGYGFYLYQQNINTKDGTFTLTGTVTEKNGGLADAGNHLAIDGLYISTGGGSLSSNPATYISDITSIHKGDRVEVRYVKDKSGYASTNCASCYVKKL